jgi:thiol:disulfide interchange protein DsbC
MRNILLSAVILFFIIPSISSYGFSIKGGDCTKCHSLKKEEAEALLKDIIPKLKVFDIKLFPVKSMWEVEIEAGGKRGIVYIDFSKKYAFSGSVIDIKAKSDLTRNRMTEINRAITEKIRVDVSKIPLEDALLMGNRDAKHKIIVFTDPDCPFCAQLHQEMKKVVIDRRDISFYIKMFPLPMHKEAYDKAKTIVCEKSLELLDDAFAKKPLPKPKCKTSVVDNNIKLANKYSITGTPAMVLPDGRVISGFKDARAIKELVDKK